MTKDDRFWLAIFAVAAAAYFGLIAFVLIATEVR